MGFLLLTSYFLLFGGFYFPGSWVCDAEGGEVKKEVLYFNNNIIL